MFASHLKKGDRVAVAMSGGVDSSVVASLAYEAGFDVVGITLQLYDHGRVLAKKGACCAGQDIYDARVVADTIGFPHYVLDYESVFQESVMNDFIDSYTRGETPLPCVRCNQKVKFKDLLQTAKDLSAKALLTGHYVQRIETFDGPQLHRGVDPQKDQSYFLFTITNNQLDFLGFPLGNLPKSVTREHAKRFGLKISDKPDSQDICFIPNGDYRSFIQKWQPQTSNPGDIVHVDGRILGTHKGIVNYTIGQRRGIGISTLDPIYVVAIDPTLNQIVVGPKEALAKQTITLQEMNWLINPVEQDVLIKVRSSQNPVRAHLTPLDNNKAHIRFYEPEYGVSPGQAGVLYNGSQVLAGGWINRN